MGLFRVADLAVPSSLRGRLLLDGHHRPRFWATYHLRHTGAAWADGTSLGPLAAIDSLYEYVAEQLGSDCLDELITNLDAPRLLTVIEGFFGRLRNLQATDGKSKTKAWFDTTRFLLASVEAVEAAGDIQRTEAAGLVSRLKRLQETHQVGRAKRRLFVRALPAEVVEDLWEIMQPESGRNPFRNSPPNRYRNFVLLLLLLYVGLRRTEAGILAVDASHSDFLGAREHHWLDVRFNPYEEEDGRALPARLKNEWAMRQPPLARPVSLAISKYVDNFRGRQPHTYLFASQWRRQLALNSINAIFDRVSTRLSKAAGRALWARHRQARVSPHDLRHTCCVVRLKQLTRSGVPLDEAIGTLKPFFGWSPNSTMPELYGRAFFEERLADVWHKDFDSHIEFVRSLPR